MPALAVHYISDHSYYPPEEFIAAVMDAPPVGSVAFLEAVMENGGGRVVEAFAKYSTRLSEEAGYS
jgi:hypothetical protein